MEVDLTVVMATLNGAKYLKRQLESIEGQSVRPRRLIVSDDGSTDETRDILSSFAERSSLDVLIVNGPRQGYGENFWTAAKLADSRYVAWSDQDDVWHPEKLSKCVRALEDTGAALVSHSATVVDENLRPMAGRRRPDYRRTRVLRPLQGDPFDVPSGFACVFRRQVLDAIDWDGRPNSHQHKRQVLMAHDQAVALICFAFYARVQLSDSLAFYRQHSNNAQGDSTVKGLAKMSTALTTSGADYARAASNADSFADYLVSVSEEAQSAAAYYRYLAKRVQLRERLRTCDSTGVRLAALVSSVALGNYLGKDRGGFGLPAFANDSLAAIFFHGLARDHLQLDKIG